jgi:nicotinic acid mononucleotide adenylyltransferase
MKRIGIYISAFDPIHEGHLDFAREALSKHDLDKLYFLVEPTPRYRQGVKAFDHRVNMTILGVAKNPKLGTIITDSKASLDEYIKLLQTRFQGQKLALIIPDYALKQFFRLPNLLSYDFNNMDIVVGLSNQSPDEINLRLRLLSETSGLKFKYSWFKAKTFSIKTSDIKRKLKQGVKPEEIPKAVYDYIISKKLYVGVVPSE